MSDIIKSKITQLPKVKGTAVPNKGVEILYRDTQTTTSTIVLEGNVEVAYEYTTFENEGIYLEACIRMVDNAEHVLAKLPLVGIRLIRFLY